MKTKIIALLFSLFFFGSLCQAESSVRYQPDWALGNVTRYESNMEMQMDMPAYPLAPLFADRTIKMSMITRHEVISRKDNVIEFRMTIENLEMPDPLLDQLLPNWQKRLTDPLGISWEELQKIFYQNFELSYQTTPQGEFIQFTHLESQDKLISALAEATNGEFPSSEWTKEIQSIGSLSGINNEIRALIQAQISTLPPHPTPFMGQKHLLGTHTSRFVQKVPVIPNLTKKEINLTLTGKSYVSNDQNQWSIHLEYPYTEKEINKFANEMIPEMIWPSKSWEKEAKSIWKEWQKNQPLIVAGVAEFSLKFTNDGTSLDEMYISSQLRGRFFPHKMPRISTATEEPVPFVIRSSVLITKISEENILPQGGNTDEKE